MGDDFITPLGLLRIQYASSLIPVPQSAQTAKPGKTRSGIRMTATTRYAPTRNCTRRPWCCLRPTLSSMTFYVLSSQSSAPASTNPQLSSFPVTCSLRGHLRHNVRLRPSCLPRGTSSRNKPSSKSVPNTMYPDRPFPCVLLTM
jgi:hypothetical protein